MQPKKMEHTYRMMDIRDLCIRESHRAWYTEGIRHSHLCPKWRSEPLACDGLDLFEGEPRSIRSDWQGHNKAIYVIGHLVFACICKRIYWDPNESEFQYLREDGKYMNRYGAWTGMEKYMEYLAFLN
jgi:hypothetical protein